MCVHAVSTKGEAQAGACMPMAGNLRNHLSWWRARCRKGSYELSWVEHGFPRVWKDQPAPPKVSPNHGGAAEHEAFVDSAVADLLASGAARPCKRGDLVVVNPLNVITKPGSTKLRLILDLRHVNDHLVVPEFKYEGLKLIPQLLEPGDRMFSIDLASGYHHVEMHPGAHPYLGFKWREQYYAFAVLPFGLASACWAFTKVMRVVVTDIRSKGLPVSSYPDDFLCGLRKDLPLQRATFLRDWVVRTFRDAGFTLQTEKSVLDPSTRLQSLGLIIDTIAGVWEVPPARWERFQQVVEEASSSKRVSVHTLMRMAGHAVSMSMALGPVVRMFTRVIYRTIGTRPPRSFVDITQELKEELAFWAGLPRTQFTAPIWRPATKADVELSSDAGGASWGAVCSGLEAQGFFTAEERAASSTLRELWAAQRALQSFEHLLRGRTVLLRVDNQGAQSNFTAGSKQPQQHAVALEVFWWAHRAGAALEVQWVPRDENAHADAITHWRDPEDWQLQRAWFQRIEAAWGRHTIDRFASHTNHLLPTFNSPAWCPGTAGVDAFAQGDWAVHHNWCNPPFRLIAPLITILREQNAAATVIVPLWRAQPWWAALLAPAGQHFATFVHGCWELPRAPDLFVPGLSIPSTVRVSRPNWRVLALRISFKTVAAKPVPVPQGH
jgi:hypothetical protein